MELCEGRSLYDIAYKSPNGLDLEAIKSISLQISKTLQYLHLRNVIHRDLKMENILIRKDGIVKLIDFGWAVHNPKNELRQTFSGTFVNMAPEIVQLKGYSNSVDIWSFGVMLYEMAHKAVPFSSQTFIDLSKQIVQKDIDFSDNCILGKSGIDLVKRCLTKKDKDRITIEQILQHQFFST